MTRRLGFLVTILGLAVVGLLATGVGGGWPEGRLTARASPVPTVAPTRPSRSPTAALPSPTPRATLPASATPTLPPNTAAMWLVGPSGLIAAGSAFDVQVLLDSSVVSRGAQFGLSFDPRLILVTGIDEGTYYDAWAGVNQASTILVPGTQVDAEKGWLMPVGIAILGGAPNAGPTGSGLLATVHLTAKPHVSGLATLRFQEVVVSVPSADAAVSLPQVLVTDAALAIGNSPGSATSVPAPAPRFLNPNAPAPWTAPIPAGTWQPRPTWTPLAFSTATATPAQVPAANLRACRAADLSAVWAGSNGFTMGQIGAWIAFGNRSPTACAAQGVPGVELRTSGGQPISLQVRPCPEATGLIVPCRPPTAVRLLPNAGQLQPHQPNPGWGSVFLFWREYPDTGPCPGPAPDPAVTLRLTLPATGDWIDVPVPAGGNTSEAAALADATCGGGLVVYPFQAD